MVVDAEDHQTWESAAQRATVHGDVFDSLPQGSRRGLRCDGGGGGGGYCGAAARKDEGAAADDHHARREMDSRSRILCCCWAELLVRIERQRR